MTNGTGSDRPMRWGIAATGGIAGEFAQAFTNLDDGVIAAVGSRREQTADEFAATHGIERAHPTYAALADDPDVDVVYVASLHPDHCPSTIMFLEAGKHVLVEKPMALNAAEADRMIDAA
ncbi:MAG: Gfo/Idh/MocA family protein, partial [Ilumatobacteraceae bacterium]